MEAPALHPAQLASTREARSSSRKDSLDLSRSQLATVPPEITRFRHLRTLDLSSNLIEAPPWALLMSLETLRELNLSLNRIRELPLALARWHSISRLDVTYNRLERFPPELWPLLFPASFARTLIWQGRALVHSALETALLEARYGDQMPRTVWHNTEPFTDCSDVRECTVGPKCWRLAEAPALAPRVLVAGNAALLERQPCFETRAEWTHQAKLWRAQHPEYDDPQDFGAPAPPAPPAAAPEAQADGGGGGGGGGDRPVYAGVVEAERRQRSAEGEAARERRRDERLRALDHGRERAAKRSEA